MHPLYRLAARTRDHLRRTPFAEADDAALARRFAEDLDDLTRQPPATQAPRRKSVRGLRHARRLLAAAPPAAIATLFASARDAFELVNWSEFYEEDAWSRPFLPEFANGEGIGPDGCLRHDALILGLFILGPGTLYPPHSHPAEEFYLVLAGTPAFQVGAGNAFEPRPPGTVVLHHAEISHAIRTGDAPFLGVYGWRGDIDAPSWYRPEPGDGNTGRRYPRIAKG